MDFMLSRHAELEMKRRGIPLVLVENVLASPEQVVAEPGGIKVYQSQHNFSGRIFLVRVVVDDQVVPGTVVTVYRTSKISKYWRKP